MKTRMLYLIAGCIFLAVATLCNGAPAPKPLPPKERFTLRSDGAKWIAFSPDGTILAAACSDKTIKLWDAAKGKEIAALAGHTAPVTGVAFSPDGKLLASSSRDFSLRLWDVGNRKSLGVLAERWGNTKNVLFSPDGKTLVGGINSIDFWDLKTNKVAKTIDIPSQDRQVSFPDSYLGYDSKGKLLTVRLPRDRRAVEVWDISGGQSFRTLEYPEKGDFGSCMAFNSDRTILASAWSRICLWDVAGSKLLGDYEFMSAAKHSGGRITSLAFNPDGKLLAVGWQRLPPRGFGIDGVISILDTGTGNELATLEGHSQGIDCMAFSPDGKILASASADRTIKLWDVRGVKAPKKKD